MAQQFTSSENPTAETAVEQIRQSLISIANDLGGTIGRASLPSVRQRLVEALRVIDESVGHTPCTSETRVAAGTGGDELAAMIALRPRQDRRVQGRRPLGRRAKGLSRRSAHSSLAHIDVILSAVAVVIALAVLIAWIG